MGTSVNSSFPPEIAEIIDKEPQEVENDFQHMKQVLFKRFKLSARALKNKFEYHDRKPNASWTDLVYELRGYMGSWLQTLEIDSF